MELMKNKVYRCRISDYTADGTGFAKIEGRAVFVPRTAVGDCCDVRIVKVTKNVAFGRVEKLVTPSRARITPACPVSDKCGGCCYQHITYEEELRAKEKKVRDALKANGKKKVVVAGLWTEVCNNSFALCAMLEGDYEIYMVADASGGTSKEAHDFAMQRMIQAGVIPVTWQQVMLEWQRDWAHKETYTAVMDIVREHSGAYGMGVDYAYTMVHGAPERKA